MFWSRNKYVSVRFRETTKIYLRAGFDTHKNVRAKKYDVSSSFVNKKSLYRKHKDVSLRLRGKGLG